MLGVGNLVKMCCYCQQTASAASRLGPACSISCTRDSAGKQSKKRWPSGRPSGRCSLKECSQISGIWEDAAHISPREKHLPVTVRAEASWKGCGSCNQENLLWRPHLRLWVTWAAAFISSVHTCITVIAVPSVQDGHLCPQGPLASLTVMECWPKGDALAKVPQTPISQTGTLRLREEWLGSGHTARRWMASEALYVVHILVSDSRCPCSSDHSACRGGPAPAQGCGSWELPGSWIWGSRRDHHWFGGAGGQRGRLRGGNRG